MASPAPEFQAVVVVDSDDSRLFPLTESVPATALPVANRPLLLYQLELLQRAGFASAIVAAPPQHAGMLHQLVATAFSSPMGVEVVPVADASGDADMLRQLADRLSGSDVVVVPSDLITEAFLHHVADQHRVNASALTMLLKADARPAASAGGAGAGKKKKDAPAAPKRTDEESDLFVLVRDTGRVALVTPTLALDEGGLEVPKALLRRRARVTVRRDLADSRLFLVAGWVLRLLEAVPSLSSIKDDVLPYLLARQFRGPDAFPAGVLDDAAPAGLQATALLSSSAAADEQSRDPSDVVRVFAHVLDAGVYCQRGGSLPTFAALNRDIVCRPVSVQTPWPQPVGQAVSFKETLVADGAEVAAKVSIKDCVIAAGCRVGTRAKLNGCVLMDNVVVGDGCVMQNCIVAPNAHVGNKSNLRDCQLGQGAVVPPESMCYGPVPNRLIVKWLAITAFVIAVVALAVADGVLGGAEESVLFPPFRTARNGLIAVCVVRMLAAVAGATGGHYRNKCQTLAFLTLTPIMLVAHLAIAAQLYGFVDGGDLVLEYSETEFRDSWIELAEDASSDGETRAWLEQLQDAESCCGWDDAAAEDQNPSYLDCAHADGCADRFVEWCRAELGDAINFEIAAGTLELAIWLFLVALVCRRKPSQSKRARDELGDYEPQLQAGGGGGAAGGGRRGEPALSCGLC